MAGMRHSRCLNVAFQAITAAFVLWITALPCEAANDTWTGFGADNHWTTVGNWSGGVAPSPGDSLSFLWMEGSVSNYNNYSADTIFGPISLGGGSPGVLSGYTIGGNEISLSGGISVGGPIGTSDPNITLNMDCDLYLGGTQTFSAARPLVLNGVTDLDKGYLLVSNTANVTFNGTVINSFDEFPGTIEKTGSGKLVINNVTDPDQDIFVTVDQGALDLTGQANNSTFNVNGASMVLDGGAGFVFMYDTNSAVSGSGLAGQLYGYSGVVIPGDSGAPGILNCDYLYFEPVETTATLQMKIKNTTAATGYSQILISNQYVLTYSYSGNFFPLDSATLDLQLSYAAQIGDSFEIIKNATPTSYALLMNGVFLGGFTQNSVYDTTNGFSLGMHYDTNGLTLTTVRSTNSPFLLWKGSVVPATLSYSNRNWSSTNNWARGLAPTNGSEVEFSTYDAYGYDANWNFVPVPPSTNDLLAGASLASILFTGANHSLYGNALTITGGISNQVSSGTNFCYLDLVAVSSLPIESDAGGTLILSNVFGGSGTVSKEGPGTLQYTGTTIDAFAGTVIVNNGMLQLDGSFLDGSFTVDGGTLGGDGTVSGVTVNSGGALKPGDSPGILHMQGDLVMSSGATFHEELNGPISGSGYDQLQVDGAVNLNGAMLELQPGFTAIPGTTFFVIINQGTGPIVGTFAGLPEGAVFEAGGQYFSITYKAGSGSRNVLLTAVSPPGNLVSATVLNSSNVQLQGIGGNDGTYTIQANTNLSTTNWSTIGTASANGSGVFFFVDTNVALFPQRFFRVQAP